jgi:hypothetical protein
MCYGAETLVVDYKNICCNEHLFPASNKQNRIPRGVQSTSVSARTRQERSSSSPTSTVALRPH